MNIPLELEIKQNTYTFKLGNGQIITGYYRNTWKYKNPLSIPYVYGVYKLRFFKHLLPFVWKHSMKKFPLFHFVGYLSTQKKITRIPTRIICRIVQK